MKEKERKQGKKRINTGNAAFIQMHKESLCLMFVAAVALLYHLLIAINFGDDVVYYRVMLDEATLSDLMKMTWEGWSSRILIEIASFFGANHIFIWKILDTAVFVLIGWALGRLTGEKIFCYAFLLMYPFHQMAEAGWIATTLNYFWPLGLGLAVCVSLKKSMDGEKVKWYEYLWSIPAILYACNQELMTAVMLVITVVCVAFCVNRKRIKVPYVYLMLALEFCSLAYILACPGNQGRSEQEIAKWVPEFAEFTFGTKLYMGFYNVERVFISTPHAVFLPVAVVLLALVYKKTENYWKTLVSSIAIILPLGHCLSGALMFLERLFRKLPETFDLEKAGLNGPYKYAIPVYVLAVVGSVLFSLYILLGEDIKRFAGVTIVVGAGFMSTVGMGFSPTLYASGTRVQIFFTFSLVYAAAMCVHYSKNSLRLSDPGKWLLISMGVFWMGTNVIGELLHILHLRQYYMG